AIILSQTVTPLSSAPEPLTISIPFSAKAQQTNPHALDPVSDPIPENNAQQIDKKREDGNPDSIDHYMYHNANNYTVNPFIMEPETPSPILTSWPPVQLNPDYLTPYHPTLHKNIHNWSQILHDQIQKKRNSKTSGTTSSPEPRALSIQAALSSTVSGIAAVSPSTFQGVSIVPTNLSKAGEDPIKVEKHFLFQTHHRERKPHEFQNSCDRTQSSRQQRSRRRIRRAVTRPFKRIARFIKRVLSTIKGEERKSKKAKEESLTKAAEKVSAVKESDHNLQYLSMSGSDDDEDQTDMSYEQLQDQNQQQQQDSSLKGVPKMMRVIDQIMQNVNQDHAEVSTNNNGQVIGAIRHDNTISTTATDEYEPIQGRYECERGPRMHPKLLELYEVTDRVLGEGTFATVKEIKLRSTGQSFALKIIPKNLVQGKGAMLDTEIAVLSKVRHPNCVSLLEMFETEDAVYLVTDLAAGGELFDQLLKKGYYTEGDAARLVREILLGVEYLHSMDIVHRDLKPENLLFLDKSENARLLITDFGLSKVLTNGNDVLMTACGTPGYVAPEVLEQVGHGKPVDMWGVGIIAYTLLCGFTPFWGEDQPALFENIIAGTYEYEQEYWKDISPLAKKFIDTLLVRDAEKRATATQALNHPWFRAVLDQDLAAPASPSDSVNLLPGVRKNFNAGNMFKKAIRAVGILRRIQATQYHHRQGISSGPPSKPSATTAIASPPPSNDDSPEMPNSNIATKAEAAGTEGGSRVNSMGFKFHDVVGAALLANQGARLDVASDEKEQTQILKEMGSDSEDQRKKADSALEILVVDT
ncbi:hypothetical protein BGX27_006561, partial [Mortierella sp. AM989]